MDHNRNREIAAMCGEWEKIRLSTGTEFSTSLDFGLLGVFETRSDVQQTFRAFS